jgi:S1-C subfamily serine protease
VTLRALVAACVPLLLVAVAIGHATGGAPVSGPAVVTVEARGERTATGFVVRDARVVTVAHAVGTGRVLVRGADGVTHQATVLRRDDALDLAVLLVPGLRAPPRALARSSTHVLVRRGGERVAVRAVVRRRLDARVRTGDGRLIARRPALELAAPIRAGDSGAPLVGADGRVAGVVFARSRDRAGVAYAIDASALERLLR